MVAIQKVAVIGGGIMGRGIAQLFVQHGYEAAIRDVDSDVIDSAREKILSGPYGLDRAVEEGYLTESEKEGALDRLTYHVEMDPAVEDADLVIEAVPEELALKGQIFRELDDATDDIPLFSNTSGFPITGIANAVTSPSRVAGMHFFNPAQVMDLVEVIRTEQTDPRVVELAEALLDDLGKTTITIEDAPGEYGFVAARCFRALKAEARKIVDQGIATEEQIDIALESGYNLPAGPFSRAGIGEEWE